MVPRHLGIKKQKMSCQNMNKTLSVEVAKT